MFWKKKNEDEITFEFEQVDQRNNVRIKPLKPLYIEYDVQKCEVLDISSAGISFHSPSLKGKNILDISLQLPILNTLTHEPVIINCTINILHTVNNIFHCQFASLDKESQYFLDQFILAEQKKQIRANNSNHD